jgi:hypothetical protein
MATMLTAAIAALLQLALPTQNDPPAQRPPLLSITEMSMNLRITANACISIQPDGLFHLETRLQQLPNVRAILHIYESTLDSFQMSRLANMLNSQSVREASAYHGPKIPVLVSELSVVMVHIPREDQTQNIGYFAWNERLEKQGESPESSAPLLKEQWRQSRTTLTPLMLWFHEIEGMRWPEVSESQSNLCNADSTAP